MSTSGFYSGLVSGQGIDHNIEGTIEGGVDDNNISHITSTIMPTS